MAASEIFNISKANPLHWRIEFGSGSFAENNPDAVPDMNLLAADIADNLPCINQGMLTCSPFQCEDETAFQFRYHRANYDPYLFVHDSNSQAWGRYKRPGQMDLPGSTWRADIDMADFDCGDCIQFRLVSIGTKYSDYTGNAFTDGEDGTFENPGGVTNIVSGGDLGNLNTVTQDGAFFRTGSKSCRINTPAVPNSANRMLFSGTSDIFLSQHQVYFAEAWIWVDSGAPIVGIGTDIYIDIRRSSGIPGPVNPHGWTDCAIVEQLSWADQGSPTDQWVQIYVKFMPNTDTDGRIALVSDAAPVGSRQFWIDDVRVSTVPTGLEATSEAVCIQETVPCSMGISYGAITDEEHEQFGLVYSNSLAIYGRFFIRIPNARWMQFSMSDETYQSDASSAENTGKVVVSLQTKVNKFRAGPLPWWMLEKLSMILKHDSVKFVLYDGASDYLNKEYVCLTKTITPAYPDDRDIIFGNIEADMRVRLYNYRNSDCGPQ